MRRRCRVSLILIYLSSASLWSAFPGLHYLDEIGHLGTPSDPRTSVRFGRTRAVWAEDNVRLEGRDDDGKRWQAILPVFGGIGFTTVWQADFDHNSRPDLLIAAYFPGNGHCVDEITLSFVLFNNRGQPVPWVIQTRMPYGPRFPYVPAIFADVNPTGVPQLVLTACAFSNPPLFGEDRSVTGIYEAKNAAWSLIKPANMDSYAALVRRSHRFDPRVDRLLPSNPADWSDQGNRLGPSGAPPVYLTALLPVSEECRDPIHLPPIVDGRVQTGWKDPCEELGRERLRLSDGTVCYGMPTVVLDGESGREIVAESEHPEQLLRKIIEQKRTVVLTGQRETNRCSPVVLWAIGAR